MYIDVVCTISIVSGARFKKKKKNMMKNRAESKSSVVRQHIADVAAIKTPQTHLVSDVLHINSLGAARFLTEHRYLYKCLFF